MSEALKQAKQEVLKGCRLTCEKNFTVGTAGNISARVLGKTDSSSPRLQWIIIG